MENKYLLITEDGTSTLFLEEYDQAMHSLSGAYEESLLKHIIPSKILEYKDEKIKVLDIGFGLGYNVLALINEFTNKKNPGSLDIISLEKERSFSEFMNSVTFHDSRDMIYNFIRDVYKTGEGNYLGINLKIIFGDARETLSDLKGNKFHGVFQDPFSPSKNPELWSVEYFSLIQSLLSESGILTTYSSACHVRKAMIEGGLHISRGPSVGKKREGTIASLYKTCSEISEEEKKIIIDSIKSTPYEDPGFNLTREKILENRLIKMKNLRMGIR